MRRQIKEFKLDHGPEDQTYYGLGKGTEQKQASKDCGQVDFLLVCHFLVAL